MKRFWLWGLPVFAAVGVASAGAIHTWAPGDVLLSSDLNSTLQHIHNTMVGGGHNQIVNSDISSSAAISHSKLATPALVPKAHGLVTQCTSTPCTVSEGTGITSVTRSSAGDYQVILSYGPQDAAYSMLLTPAFPVGGTVSVACSVVTSGTPFTTFDIHCEDDTGTDIDTGFSILIMDNEG